MIKYYLHPGMVTSIHDGQRNLIDQHKLMELYHLDNKECHWDGKGIFFDTPIRQLVDLYPLEDGLYAEEKILQILSKNK